MKALLVFCLMTLSLVSQAQYRGTRLSDEVERVARDIRYDEPRLSNSQKDAIMEHVRAIREIIQGGGYNDDHYNEASYACVARDSDDRAPWVIAIREGLNVTRINSATWNSKSSCDLVLQSSVPVRGKNLFCMSRDNDERAPYVLATLNGSSVQKFTQLSWNSSNECQGILKLVRPYRSSAIFCTARDNDSRAPYVAMELNIDTFAINKGTETFDTIAKCNEFVGAR